MIKFLTYREPDENNVMQYYVLQKDHPHYRGKISSVPIEGSLSNEPIAGYNLWIVFNYCLRGRFIPSYKTVQEDIVMCMREMAQWFYNERILIEPNRYKKFKINKDVSSTT